MESFGTAGDEKCTNFLERGSKHVFALRTKTLQIFFTMQECSPSSTPTSAVRGKEKPSKEEQVTNEVRKSAGTSASQKGGKKPPCIEGQHERKK